MMGLNKPEPVTSLIASGLNVIKQPLDYYAIDKRVPLVGGQSIADLIGLTGTQSLIQDFSQRKPMIQAGMPDARFIDVASMIPMIKPAAVATGQAAKYLGKEALRQGYEGTGLLGKIAPDIKMPIVAWHGSPHKMASYGTDFTNELNNLNPTGGLYVDYTPQIRAMQPLGKNMTTLDKTMGGSPDDIITIYRGAPRNQKRIVAGDFVTDMPELAKSYAGDGNVLKLQVRRGDVLDDINEPLGNEYIYRPMKAKKKSK